MRQTWMKTAGWEGLIFKFYLRAHVANSDITAAAYENMKYVSDFPKSCDIQIIPRRT